MIHVRMEVAGNQTDSVRAAASAHDGARILVVAPGGGRWLALGVQHASLQLYMDVVADGREALQWLGTCGYTLLLLSSRCPALQQRQIIEAARRHAGGSIPVIQLVEDDTVAAKHACLAAGLQGLLRLPVDAVKLGNLVYAWGAGQSEAPPR